jgi:hypothetical protein
MKRMLFSSLLLMVAFDASAANAPGPHEKLQALLRTQAANASKAHASQRHSAPNTRTGLAGTAQMSTPRVTSAGTSSARPGTQLNSIAHAAPGTPLRTALVPSTPTTSGIHAPTATLGGAPSAAITSRSARIDGTTVHARRPF